MQYRVYHHHSKVLWQVYLLSLFCLRNKFDTYTLFFSLQYEIMLTQISITIKGLRYIHLRILDSFHISNKMNTVEVLILFHYYLHRLNYMSFWGKQYHFTSQLWKSFENCNNNQMHFNALQWSNVANRWSMIKLVFPSFRWKTNKKVGFWKNLNLNLCHLSTRTNL